MAKEHNPESTLDDYLTAQHKIARLEAKVAELKANENMLIGSAMSGRSSLPRSNIRVPMPPVKPPKPDYGPMEEDPTMWATELMRRFKETGAVVLTGKEACEIATCLLWTAELKGKWKEQS